MSGIRVLTHGAILGLEVPPRSGREGEGEEGNVSSPPGGVGVGVGNLIFFVGGVEAPSAPERSDFLDFFEKSDFLVRKSHSGSIFRRKIDSWVGPTTRPGDVHHPILEFPILESQATEPS